jgi:hypothetical protein
LLLVDDNEYPDIKKVKSGLFGGIEDWTSGSTDDESAHGKTFDGDAGMYNGGPIDRWWGVAEYPAYGVLNQYKRFKISRFDSSAYYYLALMAHLVGDQAVPTHAANIHHAEPKTHILETGYGDNFESDSDRLFPLDIAGSGVNLGDVAPRNYYRYGEAGTGSLDITQAQLPGWIHHLASDENYWIQRAGYIGDAFDIRWGRYGFPDPNNPGNIYGVDYYNADYDTQNIVRTQVTQAISYTAGVLRAASEKLPPLVKDLQLTGLHDGKIAEVDPAEGTTISFKLMENRKPKVKVTILVYGAGGSELGVLSHEGKTWSGQEETLPAGSDLPWEKVVTLSGWKGEVGGTPLPDGDYFLKAFAMDEDGNEVNGVYEGIGIDLNADDIEANDTIHRFRLKSVPTVSIRDVRNGAVYGYPVSATITADDPDGRMISFSGGFGDEADDNFDVSYDEPVRGDGRQHSYQRKCAARTYSITGQATDQAGNVGETELVSFAISGVSCPECSECNDGGGSAVCVSKPNCDKEPAPWRPTPDDNVDLATVPPPEITTLSSFDASSPIGVLRSGYYREMFQLMATFGAKASLVGTGFQPSIASRIRLLVIPSGGLYGLDSSEIFKATLAEYVNRGGTVLSLTQAYGAELAALPGRPTGYGWMEDTSCFTKAFYIERFHPFMSGQDVADGTSDAEVDGYFTGLPAGAEVFLRRTRNGQPGLVMYPFGAGRVIATTVYTDWAYANAQAAMDGRHLVRDILAWGVEPGDLTVFQPGETIPGLTVMAHHYGRDAAGNPVTAPAERVKLTVYRPDRVIFDEREVTARVEPGTIVPVTLEAYTQPA